MKNKSISDAFLWMRIHSSAHCMVTKLRSDMFLCVDFRANFVW
eukprot:COSAG05_NODE_10159_length_580_cov_0.864865_1_plen_42_part_10